MCVCMAIFRPTLLHAEPVAYIGRADRPPKALSTLSQKSATVAVFCDSLTFLRQCGQGLKELVCGWKNGRRFMLYDHRA